MEKKSLLEIITTVAEIELVFHSKIKAKDRPPITSSLDSFLLLRELWQEDRTRFLLMKFPHF